jgi:predicted DsbA family dithiol-disulfide isomerase
VRIDVYSDTICPWCFIGKRRLERAMSTRPDVSVEVHWRPFQLNPHMPKNGLDRQHYLSAKFGGEERADQVYAKIGETGRGEGIAFRFDRILRTPNTLDTHRLVHLAAAGGRQEAAVEALFRAYFLEGIDIGEIATLVDIGVRCGLDADAVAGYLGSNDDVSEILGEDLRARRMGIDGVPCFIIDGRYAITGAQEPEAFYPLFDLAVA